MRNTGMLQVATPSELEIAMTRVFDAPRHLVFQALTQPELIQQWMLGPPGWTMPVCEVDLRVGGAYRFLWRNVDGTEMGTRGIHREIVVPERIVCTERFDQAWYPGEALITNFLVERDGKTTLTLTVRYQSQEARDMALKSGMEQGVGAGYDRMAALLAAMEPSAKEK
jgi:uncharacterized protein YndB with AHSA1/START domain